MDKITQLRVKLIEHRRTKSLSLATDICEWLEKELLHEPKKIEIKEEK
jgi:hypothetical protein